jgi:hypothetical protein
MDRVREALSQRDEQVTGGDGAGGARVQELDEEAADSPDEPGSKRGRGPVITVAIAIAALALSPAAEAKRSWVAGSIERSSVLNCPSVISGIPYTEVGSVANAEVFLDRHRLPRVGKTFYVRTEPAAIGRPCTNQSVAVEVILPRGVRLAITGRTPVRCAYWNIDTRKVTKVGRSGGCPRRARRGVYGYSLNRSGGQGPTWALPYGQALRIEVPVRSTRRLKGGAGGSISCGRQDGDPPCSARQAGDNLQFADHVLDGNASPWLSPYVPLFVKPR